MKTFSQSIKQVAAVSGLFLGAFALSVLAADVWTAAPQSPPNGNTPAPINVGTASQVKAGPFAVGQGTVAESGLDFQVAKVAKLGALWVSGDAKIVGTTTTDRLTVGGVSVGNAGYVLTNKGGTGEAEWKPNTAGLSGASRIYCAAVTDGTKYYIPESKNDAISVLIGKINREISTEIKTTSNEPLTDSQLLNLVSLTSYDKNGILKASFLTKDRTTDYPNLNDRYYNVSDTPDKAPRAYCPNNTDGTSKKLLFHSMIGRAKDEQDFNDEQRSVMVVNGNYTENYISCVAKGQDRPTLVIGMGLCI